MSNTHAKIVSEYEVRELIILFSYVAQFASFIDTCLHLSVSIILQTLRINVKK